MKSDYPGPGAHDVGSIPSWCEWRSGHASVLLVAPHGGRRPPVDVAAPPRNLRVNDVYTPEITREIAAVLDAGYAINAGMDRNALDLNRISQVRRHASWFVELLTQEIGHIIARHGAAELVFIHGWNTGQGVCDIGIGGVMTATGLHVPDGARQTVSGLFLHGRIAALQAACARRQIHATIGERYPGSHRNNLLQLFTARAAEIDAASAQRIAAWVAEGRINALQLELGIPLRWPGEPRRMFVAAMSEAFGAGGLGGGDPPPQPQRDPDAGLDAASAALQFCDPVAGIGMFAGIGRMGPRATAGRLLLFLGGQRVALFTGEAMHAGSRRIGPMRIEGNGERMRLTFGGTILLLEDAAVYLDLEAALAASQLVAAEVDLQFAAAGSSAVLGPARFGAITGHVRIDDRRIDVDTAAFANAGGMRASGSNNQTMLAAAFGRDHAVLSRVVAGHADDSALYFNCDGAQALRGVRIAASTDGDLYTPTAFELTCAGRSPLRGVVTSRMAILRPAGDAGYLRVAFGLAQFEWDGAVGHGLYEYALPVGGGEQ